MFLDFSRTLFNGSILPIFSGLRAQAINLIRMIYSWIFHGNYFRGESHLLVKIVGVSVAVTHVIGFA